MLIRYWTISADIWMREISRVFSKVDFSIDNLDSQVLRRECMVTSGNMNEDHPWS